MSQFRTWSAVSSLVAIVVLPACSGSDDDAAASPYGELEACSESMIEYMENGVTEQPNGFWGAPNGSGEISEVSDSSLSIIGDDDSEYFFEWAGEALDASSNWAAPWEEGESVEMSSAEGLYSVKSGSTLLTTASGETDKTVEVAGVSVSFVPRCRYQAPCDKGVQEVVAFDVSVDGGAGTAAPGESIDNPNSSPGQIHNIVVWYRGDDKGCTWASGFTSELTISSTVN